MYAQVDPNERPKKMRKLIHNIPSEQKQDAEELGCVLGDMTDSCSSKDEFSQDSPIHSPISTESSPAEDFGFSEEHLGNMPSSGCEVLDAVSKSWNESDYGNWNVYLEGFLVKDNHTA